MKVTRLIFIQWELNISQNGTATLFLQCTAIITVLAKRIKIFMQWTPCSAVCQKEHQPLVIPNSTLLLVDAFTDQYDFQRTPSTSQISSFACQHVLISWLSYNTDVLYLSFQGDNSYVTSIEIQSKASGGGGSQQRALVIYEAVSFDNWCSVTAKPLNPDIWHNWVSTGFASRPRFYFGHQVAAQYHNVCFLYKGK